MDYVFSWGNNNFGQLGISLAKGFSSVPTKVDLSSNREHIKHIALGLRHSLILFSDGTVYSAGSNEFGQLGRVENNQSTFVKINSLETKLIVDAACGEYHSLVLDAYGNVYSFGSNEFFQLGIGSNLKSSTIPKKVSFPLAEKMCICQISCGASHSLALCTDGILYSWGNGSKFQLGDGIKSNKAYPSPIFGLNGIPIYKISCGFYHNAVISVFGNLYTWGLNSHGQLAGSRDTSSCGLPCLVSTVQGMPLRDVACGESHTVILTRAGHVLTFGCGTYGQLGHGNVRDDQNPKKVSELADGCISVISCGRDYSFAYNPDNFCLFGFGNSENGQIGNGKHQCSFPDPMKIFLHNLIDQEVNSPVYVKYLVSHMDHSFIVLSTNQACENSLKSQFSNKSYITHVDDKLINELNNDSSLGRNPEMINSDIKHIFSSISCMNASFLKSGDPVMDMNTSSINLTLLRNFVHVLSTKAGICDLVNKSLNMVMYQLRNYKSQHFEGYRCFLYLFEFPLFHLPNVLNITTDILNYVYKWGDSEMILMWISMPPSTFKNFLKVLLQQFQHYLVSKRYDYSMRPSPIDSIIGNYLKLLDMINKINNENQILPYSDFYINHLESVYDVEYDFKCRLKDPSNYQKRQLISRHLYLYDPIIKSKLLSIESNHRRLMSVFQDGSPNDVFIGFDFVSFEPRFLDIHVRRQELVMDTLSQISRTPVQNLVRPLRVHFKDEVAQDVGGVTKEFFLLVIRELLNPRYGMFEYYPESRCIWFYEHEFEDTELYSLIGCLIYLAIYNNVILDLKFPLALYCKLLNKPLTLDNLRELDPTLSKSLQFLLDYNEPDFEDVFDLTFQISRSIFGETVIIDLIPNGSTTKVMLNNREEYVDKYVDYILNKSCKSYFESFKSGFELAGAESIINSFHPSELREIIVGKQEYDFSELEKYTLYKDEYGPNHPVILMFWKIIHKYDLGSKKKFLAFLTGSDKIPITGMKTLNFTITRMKSIQNPDLYLPVAHTCFNILDIPPYSSIDIMRIKLNTAIENCEGFGLA